MLRVVEAASVSISLTMGRATGGRPKRRPRAPAAFMPAVTRSLIRAASSSAMERLVNMARDGHRVTPALVACLSPYMREHIRRFCQYVLDMEETPRCAAA